MNTLFAVIADTAILVAVVSAIQLTVLAFRNPLRPDWLRMRGADNLASMAIAAALAFAMGLEITGLSAAGLNSFAAICLTVALILGVAIFNWRVFRCGERLRRADGGLSPFTRLDAHATPRRARARQVSG